MKFSTKSRTLLSLKIKSAQIPKSFVFTIKQFEIDKEKIIKEIKKKFNKKIIIRSSTVHEDGKSKSFAGFFESVLNLNSQNYEDVSSGIKKVKLSYKKYHSNKNEILIQDMIENVNISGVITTCDLKNYSPYYIINFDKGNDTTAVTSGKKNSENFIFFRKSKSKPKKKIFSRLILLAKELEKKFDNKFLDIEFAVKKNKIYLFQVRPIINKSNLKHDDGLYAIALKKLEKKIKKLQDENINLLGKISYFGVMPDWNPAEMIGTKPKPLSLSLYKELITDHVWALNRKNLGFRDMTSNHLMTSFFGTPFVDVRVDFNSWIPNLLDNNLANKLTNYYLEQFKKDTTAHDKVEFEILLTCYTPSSEKKLLKLKKFGFSNDELLKISKSLKFINKQALKQFPVYLKNINTLKLKQEKLVKSKMYEIDKINWLIEDCKRYGTYSFAGLARCGFIAIELLNSFVDMEIIDEGQKSIFLKNINTITTEMLIDKNKLSKNNFIKKFGHLRPDTYEITSKNYEDGYELYFKNNKKIDKKIDKKKFIFNKIQIKKINKFLFKNDLNINFSDFIFFIKESIKNREYAKYIFTKSIDLVFRELKKIARRTKININEISYIDIKYILNLYYNLDNQNISDKIKQISNENKKIYKFNLKIMLPEILSSYQDIYSYSENINKVNFVGNKTVILNTVFYKKEIKTKLKNKIVCIESADPGYDFIFNENIGGLITKFGGANSHMAIRCAELGLPAAIGVGSLLFKNITDAKIISLNPSSNKIDIIK